MEYNIESGEIMNSIHFKFIDRWVGTSYGLTGEECSDIHSSYHDNLSVPITETFDQIKIEYDGYGWWRK